MPGNGYVLTSNPYRAVSSSGASVESTMGWTRTKSDPNGRVVAVETFAGAPLPALWGANRSSAGIVATSHSAEVQTATGPAQATRATTFDGLGRIQQVTEGVTYATLYTYDAQDNLSSVNQSGQVRSFVYDSLGRLTSAANPENGASSYTYDDTGNVTSKQDARGVVVCYGAFQGGLQHAGIRCARAAGSEGLLGWNAFGRICRVQGRFASWTRPRSD